MKMRLVLAVGLLLAAPADVARAVITHPVDDALIGTVPGPAADVVGRWSTNASAVAIDPNYILTTRHQGGGVGTIVVFGGTSYEVAEITNVGTADLRIARITTVGGGSPAGLTDFTPVFTGTDAIAPFTLGGFGRERGADLTTIGGTYGYQWAAGGNTTLHFGRNTIDSAAIAVDSMNGFTSDVLVADFDGPAPGAATSLQFEGVLTEFDSGGGWFVENGPGNWQVAALNRGVGHHALNSGQPGDTALFASNSNALVPAPDRMDGVRLSSYRTFINSAIPEPTTASILMVTAGCFALRRSRRRPQQ